MPAPKKVTDEQIVEAFERSKSVPSAAKKLGITPSALYRRLRDPEMAKAWSVAKYQKVDCDLSAGIFGMLPLALRTASRLMRQSDANDSVKQALACRVIEWAMKMREHGGGATEDNTWDTKPKFEPRLVTGGKTGTK